MPDFYFRGSLVEYWRLVYAEWFQYAQGDIHNTASPLWISHPFDDQPPMPYEEVVLKFLDDYFRRPSKPLPSTSGVTWAKPANFIFQSEFHVPVTLRARSVANGKWVGITRHVEKEVYADFGKAALERSDKFIADSLAKGSLITHASYITEITRTGKKIEKPIKPDLGSPIEAWFDYYHDMNDAGFDYTFDDLAQDSNNSAGHLMNIHGNYKRERGLE